MEAKNALPFYITLLLSAVVTLLLQSRLTQFPVEGILGKTYLLNNLLAALVFTILYRLRKKHIEKLGFIFLAGTGLKFLAFFVFIYPTFHADGELSRNEFVIFFVPYALSTAVETVFLVRILNRE
jgi:F0F1-type ATP synthase assembly protein I